MPAWRAVSTTSTLDWERQPEEKGMAMNRRGGGGGGVDGCSLLMALLISRLASAAEPKPNRDRGDDDTSPAGAASC